MQGRECQAASGRFRVAMLVLTMTVVVGIAGAVSMVLLYDAAIAAQRARLVDAVRNRARLIEAIARYDLARARPGEKATYNTLKQVADAHRSFEGIGRTGEYVLAKRSGDKLMFVLSRRHHKTGVPLQTLKAGKLATPMRRALDGKRGSMFGLDYRGERVLAAYEPVAVLHLGLVAKIDLSEIREPFVTAALRGGALALVVILVAAMLFVRTTMPLVHRVEQSEAELRHAHKMEALGTLATSIAHDFNNLLMAVSTSARAAQLKCADDRPVRDDLARIAAAAVNGSSITRQLLAFSRRGEAKQYLLDLNEVVSGTRPMLDRVLGESITLELNLCDDPTPIVGERGELEQILLNLVSNARHAMPDGGRLAISTRRLALGSDSALPPNVPKERRARTRRRDCVLLTVTDTGVGMSEAVRERLFEPFFTTKERDVGTGLGLSSAYGIVSRNGGHIEVDSTEGAGATFRIYWPTSLARHAEAHAAEHREERAEQPSAPDVAAAPQKPTLLMIEDDEATLSAACFMLTDSGYRVHCADGGNTALAKAGEHADEIDAVITDLGLPDIGATELVAKLDELLPDSALVVLSGRSADDKELIRLLERERTAYFQKPVDYEQVAAAVDKLTTTRATSA